MLKDTADFSSQSTGAYSWIDEPWRISMGSPAKSRPEVETPSENHHDLCNICMYSAECMHRGTATHPKVYCELFDVDVKAFEPREAGVSPSGSDGNEPLDLRGGLCCNCENKRNCSIRPSSGNVWHCEEYR